jgi:hypothetical protein
VSRESVWNAWVSEPLNEALGDECSEVLGGVTFVVEVMQVDSEETDALGSAFGVGTSK